MIFQELEDKSGFDSCPSGMYGADRDTQVNDKMRQSLHI